jgi:hypothetical protein
MTPTAQWGADWELKACCKWLKDEACFEYLSKDLRAARRPALQPVSLKTPLKPFKIRTLMTNPKSIFTTWHTPTEELIEKWMAEIWHEGTPVRITASDVYIASQSAQWGYKQRDIAIQQWFTQVTSEDLLENLQEQATCILNEMFAARDLATELDKPPVIDPYLEQLLRLVETHIRMEDLRKASAEVSHGI